MSAVHAHNARRLRLGLRQRWQQKSRQNCYDGDDYQQLDQGECPLGTSFSTRETALAKKEVFHKRFATFHFAIRVTGAES